jgi:integrase
VALGGVASGARRNRSRPLREAALLLSPRSQVRAHIEKENSLKIILTVAEAVTRLVATPTRPVSTNTVRKYERALTRYILPHIGQVSVRDVTSQMLWRLMDDVRRGGASPWATSSTIWALRWLFSDIETRGEIGANPALGLKPPRRPRPRRPLYLGRTLQCMLGELKLADRLFWSFAFFAGLRPAEILALRWEDVDRAEFVLRVSGAVNGPSSHWRLVRSVPLEGELVKLLARYELKSGRSSGFIFGNGTAPLASSVGFRRRARVAWQAKGFPIPSAHDARLNYMRVLYDSGVPLDVMARYLGVSLETLLRRFPF